MARGRCRLVASGALAVLMVSAPAGATGNRETHDGLYVRLGGGFGYLSDSGESDPVLGSEFQGTVTGLTLVGELAVGGAVSPGVFLGAGVYAHYLPAPKANDVQWGPFEFDVEFDDGSFWLLGPFVDYYFDAREGLHLQGSVGLALGALSDGEIERLAAVQVESQSGNGVGVMFGLGHEWWVADQWSLGLLGRITLAQIWSEDDNDADWSHFVFAPALLFTATMN